MIRGAKVRTYFDFQASCTTFVAATSLDFEAVNPVDSRRGAKVRGFFEEPRPVVNFFFDRARCPIPFVLGVQKYVAFL